MSDIRFMSTEASIDAILASLKVPTSKVTTREIPTTSVHLAHRVSETLSTALTFHSRRGIAYLLDGDKVVTRRMHVVLTPRFLHFAFHLTNINSYAAIPIQRTAIKVQQRATSENFEDLTITVNVGQETEFQLVVRFYAHDEQESWAESLKDCLETSVYNDHDLLNGIKSAEKLQYLFSEAPQNRPLLSRLRTSTIELFDQFFPSAISAPLESSYMEKNFDNEYKEENISKSSKLSSWFALKPKRPRAETFGTPPTSDRSYKDKDRK